MSVKLIALAILVLGLLAVAIAYCKGRNSRSYHLVSAVVSPVSRMLFRAPPGDIAVPYANSRGQLEPDWRWMHPESIGVDAGPDAYSVFATAESVWFLNDQGPMVYRHLAGDATVAASVRARKHTDPSAAPDMEWQFAGIMLRDPAGGAWMARENYVFNVIGFCCGELQIETKSTVNGKSFIHSKKWEGGDADLSIERNGAKFVLRARRDASDPWQELVTYDRPDLPERLQVGLIVYALSMGRGRHDLQASFHNITIQ